jgi:hypothetical protein
LPEAWSDYISGVGFATARPDEHRWITRPHADGEPSRQLSSETAELLDSAIED